jgi:CAAX protease family protein
MENVTKDSGLKNKDLIASIRHTIIMAGILIIFSISGYLSNTSPGNTISASSKITLYLMVALGEWALLYYMWIGIKKTGKISLIKLINGKDKFELRFNDFLVGFVFWIAANLILFLVKYLLNLPIVSNSNENLLPQNFIECALFFLLALSAGFCEEVIYRGYFLKQFSAIFNNKWIAILLQGGLFGISHGYQGIKYVVIISVYGILFGLLVNYVKNLKPSIIAHSWQDIFSGIIYQGL